MRPDPLAAGRPGLLVGARGAHRGGGIGQAVDAPHAGKLAARLQAASSSDRPVLLWLETRAGHGQGKPRAKMLDELTDMWSFLFGQLGVHV